MLEADVMVGSGGMSVYEIAALGTPGIILGQNAREDRRMRDFAGHGTVEYLGLGTEVDETVLASAVRALLADPERRRAMSARGTRAGGRLRGDAGGGSRAGARRPPAHARGRGGAPVKALITGGAGFLGSHLAEALIARGDTVYVLDNLSTGSIENIEHLKSDRRFHYAIDSVINEPVTAELIDRVDVVFHLAAAVGCASSWRARSTPSRPTCTARRWC
jgi:hypothetical protein